MDEPLVEVEIAIPYIKSGVHQWKTSLFNLTEWQLPTDGLGADVGGITALEEEVDVLHYPLYLQL